MGGWVGLAVAVGGFVGCGVAVAGAGVWVADLGVEDGLKVADGAQVVEWEVTEAVLHVEFVGLFPGVEDSVANPGVIEVGTPVSVNGVPEVSTDGNGEGVNVTGSGSKGVLEIAEEGDGSAPCSIKG